MHKAVMVRFLVHRSTTVKGLQNVLIFMSQLRSCVNCRLTSQNQEANCTSLFEITA